jgi:hypothetical protein
MTRFKFRTLEELWTQHGYSDPVEAYNIFFKDEIEFDIEELQSKYEKERLKIDLEMNFQQINPDKMSTEEKIIYDRNLLIVECREDSNSLFKVMAHITDNEANRYNKFRDKLAQFVINTLSLLKKSDLRFEEDRKLREVIDILKNQKEDDRFQIVKDA